MNAAIFAFEFSELQNPLGVWFEWLRFFSMNPDNDRKPEPNDPESEVRLIELELMRQRAARQQAGTPYRGLRVASFMFLIVIILGALAAYYYLVSSGRLEEARSNSQHSSAASYAPLPLPESGARQ